MTRTYVRKGDVFSVETQVFSQVKEKLASANKISVISAVSA